MHYWDTSTLAKLYVNESDSALFSAHWRATGPITTSALTRWELFRLLARKETERLISPGASKQMFEEFFADVASGAIALVEMDAAVENRFRDVILRLHRMSPPVLTRTLDGVHLATADLHNAEELVATDTNLRKCAAALRLKLFP